MYIPTLLVVWRAARPPSATLLCSTGTYPRVLGVPVPDLGGARSSPPGNDTRIQTNHSSRALTFTARQIYAPHLNAMEPMAYPH